MRKLFRIGDDPYDWIVAEDRQSAIQCLVDFFNDDTLVDDFTEIKELPKDKWEDYKLYNEDDDSTESFQEAIDAEANRPLPYYLAGTEG